MSEFEDLKQLMYAEWVTADYTNVLKKTVLPLFSKSYALKLREIRVLTRIVNAPEHPTLKDVAEYLREDPATITRSTIILTGNQYIISETDSYDGRSRRLVPTELGIKAAQHFLSIFENVTEIAYENLSHEPINIDDTQLEAHLKVVSDRARLVSGKTLF